MYTTATNGSAKTANAENKTGLTGVLSGTNSNMFTLTQQPNGRFSISCGSSFNYNSFFGQNLTPKH